jgi:hypothetical protein
VCFDVVGLDLVLICVSMCLLTERDSKERRSMENEKSNRKDKVTVSVSSLTPLSE